jgi:hypothetical protein
MDAEVLHRPQARRDVTDMAFEAYQQPDQREVDNIY